MTHYVYFLINKRKIVYIGCTANPSRRINEHRCDGKQFDSTRIIECSNKERAHFYERRWTKRFSPKYYHKVGRPNLLMPKVNMCIWLQSKRIKALRELAIEEQKTISIMVENALENQYGI